VAPSIQRIFGAGKFAEFPRRSSRNRSEIRVNVVGLISDDPVKGFCGLQEEEVCVFFRTRLDIDIVACSKISQVACCDRRPIQLARVFAYIQRGIVLEVCRKG
jgi:hypothetical protein